MVRVAATFLLILPWVVGWKCIPENSPDFGTCAGLDKECCEQWLLECDLQCSSMVLPSSNVDTQGLRNFSCKNLDLKYRCQCEGSDCPQTYCASSQCYAVSNGDECSAPCSPQVTDPDCPKGTFAVFKKSYPFCPQNSQRFSCEHFDRCEPYGGEGLHTSDLKVDKGEGTNINKRFLTRNSASKHGIFGAFGVIGMMSLYLLF
mmetsp:Transcript_24888/g.56177  ORF Transcript_24888/g.56177 Transcript_24888/m.56177 type:complete len:203 (-) Transcript_24888:163-771(-)